MASEFTKGTLLKCETCGAEIAVLSAESSRSFMPRCCNRSMNTLDKKALFFECEICGAEISLIGRPRAEFVPRCCRRPMSEQIQLS